MGEDMPTAGITLRRHAVLVDALFRATAPYPDFFQEAPSSDLLQRMIDGDGRDIVTELLRPHALVLMHHRWAQVRETREAVDRFTPEDATTLPPITIFSAELERKVFQAG